MPSKRSILELFHRTTLVELVDEFDLEVVDMRVNAQLIDALARSRRARLDVILSMLKRATLKSLCRDLGIDDSGKRKADIVARLMGTVDSRSTPPERSARQAKRSKSVGAAGGGQPTAHNTRPAGETPKIAARGQAREQEVEGQMPEAQPTTSSVLKVLTKDRIVAIGREFRVAIPPSATKDHQIDTLGSSGQLGFTELLQWLGRDELKAACRTHGLPDDGRARALLADRLLKARGKAEGKYTREVKAVGTDPYRPEPGTIVQVRQRQYLVEDVALPPEPGQQTRVDLVCLDDDNQGRRLSVLWELELGAKVLQPEAHGLGDVSKLDPPRHFGAYLHALKWNSVTATDAKLFQSPFRAGIKLMNHQLTPLKKALELPRANLFIADDVGLGKTIEAGLILQELLLRQRVDFALIVCPASVALQWRDEMQKRFGLHFEMYNRRFIGRRRQERGFGVNPWSTHNRFIITFQTLRRPEYRDPLLQHIGERIRKSLLILDEAHTAAPASASKYAIDSRVTRVIRDVAPRFENRLFLSATPHNGHSNSFSALLEILDPQRFTRGVPVRGLRQLETVMVRRLKSDLRELGVDEFPERKVVQIDLRHENNEWYARLDDDKPTLVGKGSAPELELGQMLQEYTKLMRPKKGRGQLVFINLQKRLLSGIEAFARTLRMHQKSVGAGKAHTSLQLSLNDGDDSDEYGYDDETLEDAGDVDVVASSGEVQSPEGRAKQLLTNMVKVAEEYRGAPDAKTSALLEWIRRHQCPAVKVGGASSKAAWSDRRVLIFTEYGDTKRYLWQVLSTAVQGTPDADARIMQFHGGMSDDQREEVQRAFNSLPDEHPVRILIATDAAREGVNLQGHCADLFHYDVPWNPARMEQRNGRIDRTLQSAPEVRCHYFVYPQRSEDKVLQTLVGKVETIQSELGSLGTVIMDRFAEVLEDGIGEKTVPRLDKAEEVAGRREVVRGELEVPKQAALKAEIDEAGRILNRSRDAMAFAPPSCSATPSTSAWSCLALATWSRLRPQRAPPKRSCCPSCPAPGKKRSTRSAHREGATSPSGSGAKSRRSRWSSLHQSASTADSAICTCSTRFRSVCSLASSRRAFLLMTWVA